MKPIHFWIISQKTENSNGTRKRSQSTKKLQGTAGLWLASWSRQSIYRSGLRLFNEIFVKYETRNTRVPTNSLLPCNNCEVISDFMNTWKFFRLNKNPVAGTWSTWQREPTEMMLYLAIDNWFIDNLKKKKKSRQQNLSMNTSFQKPQKAYKRQEKVKSSAGGRSHSPKKIHRPK